MRKLFIFIGIMVISLVLVGCNGTSADVTPPSYTGIMVENTNPMDGTEFVTFYRAKQDTVLVEVGVSNPDDLTIKSIVVNGITYNSHRFTEESSNSTIYFEMNVGTVIGPTTYSVDRISYLNGENTFNVEGFSNNLFEVYVYKEAPSVERENYFLSRETISIDFNITDDDDVIITDSLIAKLYSGETLVDQVIITKGLVTVEFNNLLADKHYEVKVEASYDLLDGAGIVSGFVMYSGTYSTLSNGLPSATIDGAEVSSNSVLFNVDFTDNDDVVVPGSLRVEIYNGDNQLLDAEYTKSISGSTGGLSFKDLLNNNEYTIKVVADYDLNDGSGIGEDNILAVYVFTTLPREVPTPQLVNLNLQENSIEFDVLIDDSIGIIDEDTVVANLYIEDVFVDASEVNDFHVDFQINNLFANYEFRIELVADYDLNDGEGTQADQVIFNETFSTLENAVPSVLIETLLVEQGYVTVGLEVSDINNTLIGSLWAVLYEEDTEVGTIYFDTDTYTLVFDYPTEAGLSYYVEIFADYNLRDGIGAYYNQSLRRIISFTAESKAPIAEVKNVVTDSSSINLDVTVIDADSTIEAASTMVYLYHLGVLIDSEAIDVGDTSIVFDTDILSNNEYNIVIEADFNLDDGSGILAEQELITHVVSTLPKELPTANVENLESTDESIVFDIEILDTDDVIEDLTISAELFLEGVSQDIVTLSENDNFGVTFDGAYMLSDNNYKIVVSLDYDLNDGNGIEEDYVVQEINIATQPKAIPTAEFYYSEADENEITVDIYVTDPFDVISPGTLQAVLYLNDVPAVGVSPVPLVEFLNSNIKFSNLYSNARYYIKVEAVYDLNDGDLNSDPQVLFSDFVKTDELLEPEAIVANLGSSINSVYLDVSIFDLDNVIDANLEAVVYLEGVYVTSTPLVLGDTEDVTLNGLDSETEYEIKIEADYDLNEASGPVVDGVLYENTILTLALSAPTAEIGNPRPTTEEIEVDILVDNSDGTITGNRVAKLYLDDVYDNQTIPLSDDMNFDVLFTNLQSNTEYEVRVFVDYDLNDEFGEQTDELMDNMFIKTIAKVVPEINVTNVHFTKTSITFDYELDDVENVLEPGPITASLYKADTFQASKTLGGNTVSFSLSGFLAGETFEIRISGYYDLNDGNGLQSNELIASLEFTTERYDAPTAIIDEVTINQTNVSTSIVVVDTDGTIVSDLRAVLYDDTDSVVATYNTLAVGENNFEFGVTLEYGRLYSVVVLADYDLLDGDLLHDDVSLAETILGENNKKLPQSLISNVVIGEETIDFDVDVYDDDTVITPGTTFAVLYLNGNPVLSVPSIALPSASNTALQFAGLNSDNEYEIRIITGYNNDNGNGDQINYVMETELYTTEPKTVPTAEIDVDFITSTSIQFDVVIDDDSSIATTREAVLYDDKGNLVGLPAINLPLEDNINLTFSGLTSNTAYVIVIELTYDLNDGNGSNVYDAVGESFSTIPNVAPSGALLSVGGTSSTVTAIFDYSDPDSVATTYLNIYEGVTLVDSILINTDGNEQTEVFTGLDPYRTYTVKIETTYDLQDLDGVQSSLIGYDDVSTDTIISIISEVTDKRFDILQVEVVDPENILVDGTVMTATLRQYDSDEFITYIISPDGIISIDMLSLLSNNRYVIEITATYNTDGVGNETEVVFSHDFNTTELGIPEVTIDDVTNWVSSPNLTFNVTVGADDDQMATDTSWIVYLYRNNSLTAIDSFDLYVANGSVNPENAGEISVTFAGVDHTDGDMYTVVVKASIDINELDSLDPNSGYQLTSIATKTFIDAQN